MEGPGFDPKPWLKHVREIGTRSDNSILEILEAGCQAKNRCFHMEQLEYTVTVKSASYAESLITYFELIKQWKGDSSLSKPCLNS